MKQTTNKKTKVSKTTKKTTKAVKPVVKHNSFIEAIIKYWNGYFDFKGTTSRKDYWWAVLFVIIVNVFFSLFRIKFLSTLVTAVLFLPSRAIAFRRFRDVGLSGLFNLIPYMIFFAWSGIRSDRWMFAANLEVIPTDLKIYSLLFLIWGIFNLVVVLKPSKMKNNKYRK